MTRDEARILASRMDVIKAYGEGKTIELRRSGHEWTELWEGAEFLNPDCEYRVKIEPERIWRVTQGSMLVGFYGGPAQATRVSSLGPEKRTVTEFVEVMK